MDDFWTVTTNTAGYDKMVDGVSSTLETESVVPRDSKLYILDIGASTGRPLERLVSGISENTELDVDDVTTFGLEPQNIIHQNRREDNTDHAVRGAGQEIPLKDNSVDYVVSNYLLPFLDSETQTEILRETERVLQPDGGVALHVEGSRTERGNTDHPEYWILDYESFEQIKEDTDSFASYPLKPERGTNMYFPDNRGDIPSGFYDDFRDRF